MKQLIAVFALLFSMQSFANVINIDLNGANEVTLGQNVTVTLELDDFDLFDTFQFDFIFDATLFDFVGGSEDSDLPNDGIDTFLEITGGAGFVGIGFFDFVFQQRGDFFIAFDLLATGNGTSAFSLENVFFENAPSGGILVVDDSATADIRVSTPMTLSLLLMGVVALVARRFSA